MRIVSRVFALVLLLAAHAHAQPQTGPQQSCINAYAKAAVRLASARARSFNECVVEASGGQRHVATCYSYDPDGKTAAAQAKLAQVETTRCASAPDFGHAALAAATGTASAEAMDLLRQIHVVSPPNFQVSRLGCLEDLDDRAQRLLQTKLKAFGRCAKLGLSQGTVTSAAALSACLDAVKAAADAKIAKRVASTEQTAAKSCPYFSYVQGCGDQSPSGVAACVDRIADCRACQFARGVHAATTDCDTFDDGAANGSCPDACGNGAVGTGMPSWEPEVCDDGNTVDGDGCDHNCTVSGCGNGVVGPGEFCDTRNARCQGGELDGAPCEYNFQCDSGLCTSCAGADCTNGCSACGPGKCCDTLFGCLLGDVPCSEVAGTEVSCDAATCQYSGTCCKDLYLDWHGCNDDPGIVAECDATWGGNLAPCSECDPCCAFDGYCTSWDAPHCLEYEGTPVDCTQCWTP